jgi:hypothetical protein
MSGNLELNCWVLGDDYNRTFPVKIANNETVGALKDAIKDKVKREFLDVDAKSLDLWKVRFSNFLLFTESRIDRNRGSANLRTANREP